MVLSVVLLGILAASQFLSAISGEFHCHLIVVDIICMCAKFIRKIERSRFVACKF